MLNMIGEGYYARLEQTHEHPISSNILWGELLGETHTSLF